MAAFDVVSPATSSGPPQAPPGLATPTRQSPRPPRGRRTGLFIKIAIALVILALIGGVVIFIRSMAPKGSVLSSQNSDATQRFNTLNIPLNDISGAGTVVLDNSRTLSINGQLKANNGFVLTPSGQPTNAVAGQLYYDKSSNELNYYNGASFIPLVNNPQTVTSINNTGGTFTLGGGLGLVGTQLSNTGVISIASGSPNLTVTNDGSGNVTLSTSGTSLQNTGGTAGFIAMFDSTNSITNSLLSQSGSTVSVNGGVTVSGTLNLQNSATTTINLANTTSGVTGQIYNDGNLHVTGGQNNLWLDAGGVGTIFLNAGNSNPVAINESTIPSYPLEVNGDVNLTAGHSYRVNGVVIGGGGGVSSLDGLSGALNLANSTGGGTTVTINDASTAAKGIAQFNATNFTAAGGIINTIQNISAASSPTFAGINTNSITPSAALTVGATSQNLTLQGAVTTLSSTSGANTTSLTFVTPTANAIYRLQAAAAGTYDICTTAGNCVGGGVTSPGGTPNQLAKFTAGQIIGDSIISDNGSLVTISGNLTVTGTTTLSTPLAVASGGTGSATASGARTNLGAAASGANNDITSLSGLTTALSVVQGGTGATSLTANGILLGNGTSPVTTIAAGTSGQCLTATGGAPAFSTCNLQTAYNNATGGTTPEVKLNTTGGALDIQDADTTLGTNLLNIRASNGSGLGQILFGVGSTGATVYQNSVNSATAFMVENAAGAAQLTVDTTGSRVVIGALQTNTISPTAALTIGATGQSFTLQGNASSTVTATGGGFTTTVGFSGSPTGAVTYNFDRTVAAGTYTICTTIGNCAGTGTGVTTSGGTTNAIPKFLSAQSLGNSIITDNGSTVTIGGALGVNTITPTAALTIGATGQNLTLQGATVNLTATSGGVTNSLTFATPASGNKTITLPNASGTVAVSASGPLTLDAAGNLTCPTCVTSGGGGGGVGAVDSVDGLTGALTIANSSGVGSTITINNASTAAKGIAQFNATNFTASSGTVNTIQDITTASAPTFGQLTLSSSQATAAMLTVNNTNGSGTGNLIDLQLNGSSKFSVAPNGNATVVGTLTSGAINGQTISSSASFTGTLGVTGLTTLSGGATVVGTLAANTLTPSSSLTVGATGQSFTIQGNASSTITATGGGFTTTIGFSGAPTGAVTYNFDRTASAGTYTICTTVGNCAGSGSGVTTPGGTANTLAKFTAGQAIGNSGITDDGTTITLGENVSISANKTLALANGTGTVTQTYTNTTGTASTLNATNSASSSTTTVTGQSINLTGTNNAGGANTVNGISFGNVTAATNNSFYGLNFGTGMTDILRYNGAQLISGTGLIQNAAFDSALAYTNITKVGALTSGSIASGFGTIATANTITGTTLNGTTGINTGAAGGTQRIDSSGNLVNIGTITSGLINGQTISSAANFTGTLGVTGLATLNGGATVVGTLTANTITPSSSLTVGATGQAFTLQGNASSTVTATGGGFTTTVGFSGAPTAAVTYNFDRTVSAGTYTICTTFGNCAGTGGGVTTPGGTTNSLAKFTAGQVIGNSGISDDGTTISTSEKISQAFTGTSGTGTTLAVTDSSASGASTLQGMAVNITGTNTSGTNTITGVNFGNVAAATNNTYNGIAFGTGFNSLLSYNGTQLISGAGLLQNAAIDSTLAYSNLQKVGTLSVGSIVSGFGTISTTNNISTTATVQGGTGIFTGANALTVGTASTNTGAIVFKGSGGTGTLTLQGPTTPNAGNFTLTIPAITGNANICTDNSVCTGYAAASGSSSYVQLQGATPGSAQTGHFNITGTGIAGTAIQTPLVDAATAATALNVGTTNANQINLNQNTAIATNKSFTANGAALFQDATNSTTALKVVNSANTSTAFDVDTTNSFVGIGTSAPSRTLDTSVNNSQITAPMALFEQAGSGDANIEFKTAAANSNYYVGVDSSNSNTFTINSYIAATSTVGSTYSLGNGTNDGTHDFNTNFMEATNFTTTTAGTVSSITVDMRSVVSTSDTISVALYANSAGAPGALLASSTPQTISITNVNGDNYNTLTIPTTALTASTQYWLSINTSGDDQFWHSSGTGHTTVYLAHANTSWPNPFGTPTSSDANTALAAYATVTPTTSLTDANANPIFTLSQTGRATFKNSADSATAFQVQNTAGGANLTVDTSNNQVVLGKAGSLAGKLVVANASNSNIVTLQAATSGSGNNTITIPNETGTLCTTASTVCSLQTAYNASTGGSSTTPTIKLNNSVADINIQDTDGGLGAGNFLSLRAKNAGGLGAVVFGFAIQGQLFEKPTTDSATTVQIENSSGNTLFAVDSSGGYVNIGSTGGSTGGTGSAFNGTTTNIETSPNANTTTNIGGTAQSSGTATINIGFTNTAGGGSNVNIGSGGTASSGTTTVRANGALTLTSGTAATWSTTTGNLTLQAGGTSSLLLDTGGAGTVSVGNTNATTVNIGGTASAVTNIATGDVAHTVHIGDGGSTTSQSVTIGSTGSSTSSTNIQGGSGGGINIGFVASAQTIHMGSAVSTSTTSIQGGNGSSAVQIDAQTGGTVSIASLNNEALALGTGATSNTITIGGTVESGLLTVGRSTSSNTISIGDAATTNTQTVNIATSATSTGVDTVTIGSTNSSSATTLQGGTGNINLTTNSASAKIIAKSNTNSTTAFQVNSSGSTVLDVDTTNGFVGIGNAAPSVALDIGPSSLGASQLIQARLGDLLFQSQQGSSSGIVAATSRGSNGNLTLDGANGNGVYLSPSTTNNNFLAAGGGKVMIGGQDVPTGNLSFETGADKVINVITATSGNNGNALTMQAGSGNGTNKNGGNLVLQGGNSTGSGAAGVVIVKPQTDSTTAFQVQNASGVAYFIADTTNERLYVGPSAGDTTGALLVLGNKTNVGDPTGVEGGLYYNNALKEFRCYRNGYWSGCDVDQVDSGFNVTDEFLSGGTSSSGLIGALGWNRAAIGSGGVTFDYNNGIAPTADHPGIIRFRANNTGGVANSGLSIALGNGSAGSMVLSPSYDMKATAGVESSTSGTQTFRVGFHNEHGSTTAPTTGVWWEADPTVNANWRYCYVNATPATICASSGVGITASVFARLEIHVTALGSGTSNVVFTINSNGNSATNTISGVTVNTTNLVYPAMTCYAQGTSEQDCDVDYYQASGTATALR